MDESLKDKDVIVVEDIVDSGRTLSYLLEMLRDRGPASLRLCTLLDKPDRRVIPVDVDYTGFEIPDQFVVTEPKAPQTGAPPEKGNGIKGSGKQWNARKVPERK